MADFVPVQVTVANMHKAVLENIRLAQLALATKVRADTMHPLEADMDAGSNDIYAVTHDANAGDQQALTRAKLTELLT